MLCLINIIFNLYIIPWNLTFKAFFSHVVFFWHNALRSCTSPSSWGAYRNLISSQIKSFRNISYFWLSFHLNLNLRKEKVIITTAAGACRLVVSAVDHFHSDFFVIWKFEKMILPRSRWRCKIFIWKLSWDWILV